MDLRFPHHENERAQAVALGKRFANHWMHHAFVVDAEGEKMSKSLGNVDNLLDLLDRYDDAHVPACCCCRATTAARCASAPTTCEAAERALAGLDAFAAAHGVGGRRPSPTPTCSTRSARRWTTTSTRRRRWRVLFDTVRRANAALDAGRPDGRRARRRGAGDRRRRRARARRAPTRCRPTSLEQAAALDAARAAKDYATADAIRAELQADGWIVETTAAGTTVRR